MCAHDVLYAYLASKWPNPSSFDVVAKRGHVGRAGVSARPREMPAKTQIPTILAQTRALVPEP